MQNRAVHAEVCINVPETVCRNALLGLVWALGCAILQCMLR